MPLIFTLLYLLLFLFFLAMMVRLVFDWVQQLAREWRPRGIALVAATGAYSVTDPPVKLVRRLLPPLNLGAVSLDIGFLVLLFVTGIAMSITFTFAA